MMIGCEVRPLYYLKVNNYNMHFAITVPANSLMEPQAVVQTTEQCIAESERYMRRTATYTWGPVGCELSPSLLSSADPLDTLHIVTTRRSARAVLPRGQ